MQRQESRQISHTEFQIMYVDALPRRSRSRTPTPDEWLGKATSFLRAQSGNGGSSSFTVEKPDNHYLGGPRSTSIVMSW